MSAPTDTAKRVLILSHSFAPNVGGVETHLSDLVRALADHRQPAVVLTYKPLITRVKAPWREQRDGIQVIRLPWIGFGLFNQLEPYPLLQFLYLFPPLFLAAFLFVLFRRRSLGALHVHGMVCAVMGRCLKTFFRLPLVVSTHAVYGWLYTMDRRHLLPRFLAWVLTGADAVLALSEKSRQEMLAIGVPPEKARRFTYWVDQGIFSPMDRSACRAQAGWADDRFTVLFVGRLIQVKGVELLLQVASELPAIRFAFAGDGPLRDRVEAASRQQPNVCFPGRIDNRDLPRYYNAADVLCVPSLYEEGFGRILIEALSCGCPIVATRLGAIPEAVDDTVAVLTAPEARDVADAIRGLASDSIRLAALRARCRTFAIERYSARNADGIIAAYGLPAGNR